LNVWKKRGKRAAHKPLLVLYAIGKLLRGESRLISFKNSEGDLKNLLKEFGPWKSNHLRPQYPFWRLRNGKDSIWEIPNEDRIHEGKRKNGKSTGDAIIGDLRLHGVGGFLEPIANQIQNDSKLAFKIAHNLLW
jgi:putative restriction endonuclease